jgi:mannose-6-phosphate isomerase-like protein (cupin superfamily)
VWRGLVPIAEETLHIERAASDVPKGWSIGPWNSSVCISVGFANEGIDDPHFHQRITEIYMVARGMIKMRVEQQTVQLSQNDVIVIEPGEAHTFLAATSDYFHFVVQSPGLVGAEAVMDKIRVKRERLGL